MKTMTPILLPSILQRRLGQWLSSNPQRCATPSPLKDPDLTPVESFRFTAASLAAAACIFVPTQPVGAQTTQWVRIQTDPANTPPGREAAAMAYDEKRQVILMHSGDRSFGSILSDTWEWDGVEWTKMNVAAPSQTRIFFSMAFDSRRRKVVLFGGSPTAHSGYRNQTWEYGLIPLQLSGVMPGAEGNIEIRWTGELPPYQLQSCASLSEGEWKNEGELTDATSAVVQAQGAAFFRVVSLFEGSP